MSTPLLVVQKGGKQHRQWRMMAWGYAVVAAVLIPLVLEPFEIGKMNRALALTVAILAVNMVVGFNGLLALGHSAFMGIGAFMAASLVQDEGWDYWMAIPFVLIAAFAVGIIVGLPALRVRGLYLALVTIAQAAVFPTLVNLDQLTISERTGGPNGKRVDEVVGDVEFREGNWFEWLPGVDGARGDSAYRYWIILLITAITIVLVRNMIRSRPGRGILAIRDNEAGAAVYGVNLPIYRTVNFALSSAVGALAGLLWCMDKSFVAGQDFTFILAIDLIIGLVIGGVGTLQGSILGGLFVVWVRDLTKRITVPLGFYELDGDGPLSAAIFGLILILFTFFAPGGIASLVMLIQRMVIRVVPNKPDGTPVVPIESTDPGPESTRAKWAMRLAIIGPLAMILGWLLMNIDHLIVGVVAFVFRSSIVVMAPIAVFVGANELRAARANKRGDNAADVASQARTAAWVGILSFAYVKAYLLNVALLAHHGSHLTREWVADNPDATLIDQVVNPVWWLFGNNNPDYSQPMLAIVLTVIALAGTIGGLWYLFLRDGANDGTSEPDMPAQIDGADAPAHIEGPDAPAEIEATTAQ